MRNQAVIKAGMRVQHMVLGIGKVLEVTGYQCKVKFVGTTTYVKPETLKPIEVRNG